MYIGLFFANSISFFSPSMKKILIYIAFAISFLSIVTIAQADLYPVVVGDNQYASSTLITGYKFAGLTTVVDLNTEYTILSIAISSLNECGVRLYFDDGIEADIMGGIMDQCVAQKAYFESNVQIHGRYPLIIDMWNGDAPLYYAVQYVPYDTRLVGDIRDNNKYIVIIGIVLVGIFAVDFIRRTIPK